MKLPSLSRVGELWRKYGIRNPGIGPCFDFNIVLGTVMAVWGGLIVFEYFERKAGVFDSVHFQRDVWYIKDRDSVGPWNHGALSDHVNPIPALGGNYDDTSGDYKIHKSAGRSKW